MLVWKPPSCKASWQERHFFLFFVLMAKLFVIWPGVYIERPVCSNQNQFCAEHFSIVDLPHSVGSILKERNLVINGNILISFSAKWNKGEKWMQQSLLWVKKYQIFAWVCFSGLVNSYAVESKTTSLFSCFSRPFLLQFSPVFYPLEGRCEVLWAPSPTHCTVGRFIA